MKHILIITAIILSFAACESRLDEMRPHNKAEEASYLSSFSNILSSTSGLYAQFLWSAGGFSDTYFYTVAFHAGGELRGNNVVFHSPFVEPAELNIWFPDSHFFLHSDQKKQSFAWTLWSKTHQIALGASKNIIAIDKMLASDVVEPGVRTNLTRLKGENLFLRGLIYFNALNAFGKPYWDEPDNNPGLPLDTLGSGENLRQASVHETFERIITDFRRAADLLPDERADRTYANKTASFGMLSRAYLYMGGTPDAPNDQYNRLAAQYADSTFSLKNDVVSLAQGDDMKGVFDNPKDNAELLFSFYPGNCNEPMIANLIHSFYSWWGPMAEGAEGEFEHSCVISKDYEAIMDVAKDLRWIHWTDTSAYHLGRRVPTKYDGCKVDLLGGMIPGYGFYFFQSPIVFLRAAEIYLNRAEALVKLGEDAKALDNLNVIRERAGLSPLSGLSGRALFDEIFLERRRELAFESQVYYDYTRNGITMKRAEVSAGYPAFSAAAYNEMNPHSPARRLTYAIPAEELLLNKELLPN